MSSLSVGRRCCRYHRTSGCLLEPCFGALGVMFLVGGKNLFIPREISNLAAIYACRPCTFPCMSSGMMENSLCALIDTAL